MPSFPRRWESHKNKAGIPAFAGMTYCQFISIKNAIFANHNLKIVNNVKN